MGTKTLEDINRDLKLLITALTGFEGSDEGFHICERFVLSNIKNHRYLSVDGHATRRTIDAIGKKFSIHGKYEVAKKFDELVTTFLSSFDFEHHPQYDLQWSLLTMLFDLSSETNKSDLKSLRASKGDRSLNLTLANQSGIPEDTDWGQYLTDGQEEFFNDYRSSSESEWSDEDEPSPGLPKSRENAESLNHGVLVKASAVGKTPSSSDVLSEFLAEGVESRKWLEANVQNRWWNRLEWSNCDTDSRFSDAHLCDLWNASTLRISEDCGTLSEYQACRELLWMFHAPGRMAIFRKNSADRFSVRDDVSIPSLTPRAFGDVLSRYCEFYAMLNDIENFGKNLYRRDDSSGKTKLPPLTYEEYNAAVIQHLNEVRVEIQQIEIQIMKQDDCHTFLTLSRDLEKCMRSVRLIYEIHRAVTMDWRVSPNWMCATKLLSGLYREIQYSSSRERTNICASLYLSSVGVYLNVIATWLSEGRLEDWRDEFLIARIPEVTTVDEIAGKIDASQNNERTENFTVRKLDEACLSDPVINLIHRKVKHMGRNIELLVTLDRISDMWEMNVERDTARISLNDEFLNEVTSEFSKYNQTDRVDATDVIAPYVGASRSLPSSEISDSTPQQMLRMDNPFLMKAFEEYLPIDHFVTTDRVDATHREPRETIGWGRSIFRKLEIISATAILPFRKVLENALEKVLDQRYSCASKLVKDILVKEYKLEGHLKLMRCVYMMERGHVMTQFYRQMFTEIESSTTWKNENSLTCILQEVLSQEWPDSSSRWSIDVDDVETHKVLQAADRSTLHYSIGWPVNMVLNAEALEKYNAVFRFQLKLKWALWTLTNLRFRDLEENSSSMSDKIRHFYARRLESLRFWLMHAIGSVHAYLAGQVLQGFGIALEKHLAQANNLDTIITVHNEYLEKVHEHCLQTVEFEDLMATIHNLLAMCVRVRDRWNRGASALIASDLDLMETSYTKYHTYIALALHNAVQHKDADYYKLTPSARICEEEVEYSDKIAEDRVTDLSRDLLTEVAHQSLPPSGIPIPVPALVRKRSDYWNDNCVEPQLPEYDVSLNQYDQTFSYIRWYHYEEYFLAMNRSSYDLSVELAEFVNENGADLSGTQ